MPKLPEPNQQSLANLEKLNKIEAMIGKPLLQRPIEEIMKWESRYGYSCDVRGM